MDATPAGSALAFVAFGAQLMGTAALLLFNPRDRVLRWYTVFSMFLLGWLALQGTALAVGFTGSTAWWYGVVVHMLPVAFMTMTLVQTQDLTDRAAIAILVIALLVLLLIVRNPMEWRFQFVWHTVGWGAGAVLYITRGRAADSPGASVLGTTLNILVPVGVAGAIIMRRDFIVFGLPAITMATMFLLFVGIVYHRYYNIEVRARRSGAIGLQAVEQERLALLGEISASIAHEVRNPLTGMRSLAQRLRDESIDDDRRHRYLSVILDEIGRLDRIVTNLTDVARRPIVRANTEVVELGPLFADLELLVESKARVSRVTLVGRASALRAKAPRDPLAQALLNLLLNAIAHAPPGTRVELLAERLNGTVALLVRDQGAGIDAADRERVFEPFHTGSGGTGLGLTVVRTLARDHGWTVQVGDVPAGGAELRLIVQGAS